MCVYVCVCVCRHLFYLRWRGKNPENRTIPFFNKTFLVITNFSPVRPLVLPYFNPWHTLEYVP